MNSVPADFDTVDTDTFTPSWQQQIEKYINGPAASLPLDGFHEQSTWDEISSEYMLVGADRGVRSVFTPAASDDGPAVPTLSPDELRQVLDPSKLPASEHPRALDPAPRAVVPMPPRSHESASRQWYRLMGVGALLGMGAFLAARLIT